MNAEIEKRILLSRLLRAFRFLLLLGFCLIIISIFRDFPFSTIEMMGLNAKAVTWFKESTIPVTVFLGLLALVLHLEILRSRRVLGKQLAQLPRSRGKSKIIDPDDLERQYTNMVAYYDAVTKGLRRQFLAKTMQGYIARKIMLEYIQQAAEDNHLSADAFEGKKQQYVATELEKVLGGLAQKHRRYKIGDNWNDDVSSSS